MARGAIRSLTPDTTYDLMVKVMVMCSKESRSFEDLLDDDFIAALSLDYSERVVKDYIMSICKLGFITKSSVTHIRFDTTDRGYSFLDNNKRDPVALPDLRPV